MLVLLLPFLSVTSLLLMCCSSFFWLLVCALLGKKTKASNKTTLNVEFDITQKKAPKSVLSTSAIPSLYLWYKWATKSTSSQETSRGLNVTLSLMQQTRICSDVLVLHTCVLITSSTQQQACSFAKACFEASSRLEKETITPGMAFTTKAYIPLPTSDGLNNTCSIWSGLLQGISIW